MGKTLSKFLNIQEPDENGSRALLGITSPLLHYKCYVGTEVPKIFVILTF